MDGYLSEILLNVWVDKNRLKVKHVGVMNTSKTLKENIKWKIKMTKGWLIGSVKRLLKCFISYT